MAHLNLQPLSTARSSRLLRLHPSSTSSSPSTLHATLFEADIPGYSVKYLSGYECLSYTWGEPTTTASINIIYNDENYQIPIRRNLEQALLRLRLPDKDRIIWVDALSISQTDLDEKAQQVKQIGEIFQRARRVLVWVGEHADGSEMLFDRSHENKKKKKGWRGLFTRAEQSSSEWESIEQVCAWAKFMARPYWNRTWIVQEVVCARELWVCCGASVRDWETLVERRCSTGSTQSFRGVSVVSIFRERLDPSEADVLESGTRAAERLMTARRSYQLPMGGYFNLMEYLRVVAYTNCFDRRDKIYSILSLEPDAGVREQIGVDYTVEAPELFVKLVRVIAGGENLADNLIYSLRLTGREIGEVVDLLLDSPEQLGRGLLDLADFILSDRLHVGYQPFERSGNLQEQKKHLLAWRSHAQDQHRWPYVSAEHNE